MLNIASPLITCSDLTFNIITTIIITFCLDALTFAILSKNNACTSTTGTCRSTTKSTGHPVSSCKKIVIAQLGHYWLL